MKKLLCVALLAAVSMPASAATYIKITGSGQGNGSKIANGTGDVLEQGPGFITFTLIARPALDMCGGASSCSANGTTVGAHYKGSFGGVVLNFDQDTTGWVVDPAHFIGGTASGSISHYPIANTFWSGTIDQIQVETIESAQPIDRFEVTFAMVGVPEPASWAMMIGGLGLVGASMRRRREVKLQWASAAG